MGGLIGSRVPRIEDEPFLRGKGRFIDDVAVAGLLHAASCAARIHTPRYGVDKTAALALRVCMRC